MPRYHFNLVTASGVERDDIGCWFPDVESALSEAHIAAMEISADTVRCRRSPAGYRFEVRDSEARLMFDLPFDDVVKAAVAPSHPRYEIARERLEVTISRSRQLQAELASGFVDARRSLAAIQKLLRGDGR